jgi:hypothetical protein
MTLKCPICKKSDSIQKVSSIVDSGTSTTVGTFSGPSGGLVSVDGKVGYAGGYTTLSGSQVSKTNLATRLSPPHKPILKGGLGWWWLLIIFGLFASYCPISIFSTFPGSIINSNENTIMAVTALICIAYICLCIIYLVFFIYLEIKTKKKNKERYIKEAALYQEYMKVWNELYYCFRDDVIFNLETGKIYDIRK